MDLISTLEELLLSVGENIRTIRLQKNFTQEALTAQAGVSKTALRHLESGQGANLATFIRVVRSLDKQEWLKGLAPMTTIHPLHMVKGHARQRARARQPR